jgi:predicted ATPase/class 3 adenylate cyclase
MVELVELSKDETTLMEMLLPASLASAMRHATPFPAATREAYHRLADHLQTLLPCVPAPVLAMHLADPMHSAVTGQYFTGTLVIADLSGFTALSNRLATAGRQGSEEISAIINRLFGMLLDEIYAYGGGVVKFGGDAVTAFFDTGDVGDDHALRACAAVHAIQVRMHEFADLKTSQGVFSLHLRISVHSDRIFFTEVGTAGHTTLIMTGRAVNRLMVAQEAAMPGEIILSDETRRSLSGIHTHQKLPGLHLLTGFTQEPLPPPTRPPVPQAELPVPDMAALQMLLRRIARLRSYVPYDLPRHFLRASAGHGEFRPVTLLFANFYAFRKLLALLELSAQIEHDTTIIGRVLNTYYCQTQSLIRRYGGSVNKVDMATFGDRLMAIFGAPIAHEDDPTRAVQAALELRATLDNTDQETANLLRTWTETHPEQRPLVQVAQSALRQRIGIAGGVVFAGIVGAPQRYEYTVIGETVNLAARLLDVAREDDILLTSRTYHSVSRLVQARPLSPQHLKGFAEAIQIYRAIQKRAPTSIPAMLQRATPLVGRDAALTRLLENAQQALAPDETAGRVLVLIGEAGVGKSRLASEAMPTIQAVTPTVRIVRGECQSYEQTTPYAVVTRLLPHLLQISPSGGREAGAAPDQTAQIAAVQQQLETLVPEWTRFAPLLAPLLHLPIPETELIRALTPDQRHERLQDLILMLCFAVARRQSLVVLVDNLQWIDASSRALLERLAQELVEEPLLLVLIYRPFPVLEAGWSDLPHCTVITLENLKPADSATLLAALLDGDPPAELRTLFAQLDGTPLFQEETVRYLLESGTLQRDRNGNWIATRPADSITVPLQIEQLIIARLDRLDEDSRALLQLAAVIGQHFTRQLLAAVVSANDNGTTLEQRLHDLVNAAIILPNTDEDQPAYQFKHALIREVAYGSMLFVHRRRLHARVAAAIEQIYGDQIEEQHALLAEHYRLARLTDRAFPHFLEAARRAQARYANDEAIKLYQQALATAPWQTHADTPLELAKAAIIYENLGDVLALTGEYSAAREQYGELLGMYNQHDLAGYAVQRAGLQRKIGGTHEHEGRLEVALLWLAHATETIETYRTIPPTDAMQHEHVRVLSDIGSVYFRREDLKQAQHYLEQALAAVAPQGMEEEQAQILNRLGGIAYTRGNMQVARYFVQQSLAASEQRGDLVGQAKVLNNLGNLTGMQGLFEESIRYALRAIEINERIGNRRELAITMNNIGWAFYDMENYQEAHNYFSQAVKQAVEIHDKYHQMLALLNLGDVLIALQQLDEAENTVFRSQFLAAQMDLPAKQLDCHTMLSEIALQRNDLAGNLTEYQEGLALDVDPQSEEYGRFQRLEARIAAAQGNRERAVALLQANAQLFTELQNMPEVKRTRKLLTELTVEPEQVPEQRSTPGEAG